MRCFTVTFTYPAWYYNDVDIEAETPEEAAALLSED